MSFNENLTDAYAAGRAYRRPQ